MTKRYIRSCQIESVSLDLHGRVSPDLSNLYLPENNRHYKVSEEVKKFNTIFISETTCLDNM